ncbi:SGNH/GDSL hydrolase family protein [Kocuria oceani]|uniref:SGNH/GDSL hydrolase family protein n=1 Tax=Kocuria oceani TaxID=988827 RepID=UPI004036472D
MSDPTTASAGGAAPAHPWCRMVSIGDSFTEGIGDPDPAAPGGHRGWADRVAEELHRLSPGLSYANLAIRGRVFRQIVDEQVPAALELSPDLVTVCAGGNDMLRPGADPDAIAEELDEVVGRMGADGASVVLFDGPDIGATPVLRGIRGRVAVYNENVRVVASRHDAALVDLWGLRELADPAMWAPDRLHFSPLGHHRIAVEVLDTLGVEHGLVPERVLARPPVPWRQARREDLVWAHRYLRPWVARRIRRTSSGPQVGPKRPGFGSAAVTGGGMAPGDAAPEA